jgi:pyridine nucleotide-disulfide oxidoreductase
MDGSRVIFMIMLIVMPLLLSAGIALPFLADSPSGRKDRDIHTTFAALQGSGPVRPRVLIVGAGFAGLKAARALRHADADADADVTIVDGHDYHTFQPLPYHSSTNANGRP